MQGSFYNMCRFLFRTFAGLFSKHVLGSFDSTYGSFDSTYGSFDSTYGSFDSTYGCVDRFKRCQYLL